MSQGRSLCKQVTFPVIAALLDNYLPALVWNQDPNQQYWFHYTTRDNARAIVALRRYRVGPKHNSDRSGLYVCPFQPGSKSEDELAGAILDGSWDERSKLKAAVVLRDGPDVQFESDPDTAFGMRFRADPRTWIELPNQVVGWAAYVDGAWKHSLALFDRDALTQLGWP